MAILSRAVCPLFACKKCVCGCLCACCGCDGGPSKDWTGILPGHHVHTFLPLCKRRFVFHVEPSTDLFSVKRLDMSKNSPLKSREV